MSGNSNHTVNLKYDTRHTTLHHNAKATVQNYISKLISQDSFIALRLHITLKYTKEFKSKISLRLNKLNF